MVTVFIRIFIHYQATVIHYANSEEYNNFKASDWVPENKELYQSTSGAGWGGKGFDFSSKPLDMRAEQCTNALADGSTWHVTRVGPMR